MFKRETEAPVSKRHGKVEWESRSAAREINARSEVTTSFESIECILHSSGVMSSMSATTFGGQRCSRFVLLPPRKNPNERREAVVVVAVVSRRGLQRSCTIVLSNFPWQPFGQVRLSVVAVEGGTKRCWSWAWWRRFGGRVCGSQ